MLDINPQELIARIWRELLPGEAPHHRSDEYRKGITDCLDLITKMVNERDAEYDEWYINEVKQGRIILDA